MSYVAGWRMNVACRELRDSEDGLANVARNVASRCKFGSVGQRPVQN